MGGVLIPWRSIDRIEFYVRVSGNDHFLIKCVRLYLTQGHRLPIGKLSVLRRPNPSFVITGKCQDDVDWDNTVFLNAVTDFGAPHAYADTLEVFRKEFAL